MIIPDIEQFTLMTDPKLEKKIEKLLNYKCLNYLSGNNKYKSKSSTPNHSSLKDTPNTDRSDSKSNKHYPVIVERKKILLIMNIRIILIHLYIIKKVIQLIRIN